ncbi:unnamed protein product [Rotaria sp. Silwood1]|nr:unnamed protein product [Rotaria sp. Silwood1]CAF4570507.1 unnamed protein product [Rotaria sp. Silwood1]CAF4940608.1 unnamed protein product [Rotaria sp. Silwood1]
MLLSISILLLTGIAETQSSSSAECFTNANITCCNGYILQVINKTSAVCVQCLKPGARCYQTSQSCCPGYQCYVSNVILDVLPPEATCIQDLIAG